MSKDKKKSIDLTTLNEEQLLVIQWEAERLLEGEIARRLMQYRKENS